MFAKSFRVSLLLPESLLAKNLRGKTRCGDLGWMGGVQEVYQKFRSENHIFAKTAPRFVRKFHRLENFGWGCRPKQGQPPRQVIGRVSIRMPEGNDNVVPSTGPSSFPRRKDSSGEPLWLMSSHLCPPNHTSRELPMRGDSMSSRCGWRQVKP